MSHASPTTGAAALDPAARDAAFARAFPATGGPGDLLQLDEATAAAELAPCGATPQACSSAVRAVRALRDAAIEVAEGVRDGALGEPPANEASRRQLADLVPGFSAAQYDAALALGLWYAR